MANNIKLFTYGSGFILDNDGEKYHIDGDGVVKTTLSTTGLEEVPFDIIVQGMLDNAASTISQLQEVVQTEIENFE